MPTPRRKPVIFDGGFTAYPQSNGTWRVRWYEDGEQRNLRAKTIEEAEQIVKVHQKRRNVGITVFDAERTVADLVAAFMADQAERVQIGDLSPRTWGLREGVFRLWVLPTTRDGQPWPGLGETKAIAWRAPMSEKLLRACSLETGQIQNIGGSMRALVTWGHRHGWIPKDENPMEDVKFRGMKRARQQGLSEHFIARDSLPEWADIERIIKAWATLYDDTWALAIELVACSGLRWGELAALRACEVRFTPDRQIFVLRAVQELGMPERVMLQEQEGLDELPPKLRLALPKGDKTRETIFKGSIARRLQYRVEDVIAQSGPKGLLFPGLDGGFAARGSFYQRWCRAAEAAGWECRPGRGRNAPVPPWSIHDLRHYFACWLLFDLNADPADVSYWMGHHSVTFTIDRYIGRRGNTAARGTAITDQS